LSIKYGLNNTEDSEGRVITLEFKKYYLVNVYTPNAQHGLTRLNYRMQWDQDFLMHLKSLEKTKPIIFGGDLNVAHKEIDLKNPKSNERNPGFTIEERTNFDKILNSGFIDTFREFNQNPDQYTWWSYRFNARKRNIGWRIDYFCVSKNLKPYLENAFILKDRLGSDHAPVGIILKE
jgi:exodeoxyribonuclease-3